MRYAEVMIITSAYRALQHAPAFGFRLSAYYRSALALQRIPMRFSGEKLCLSSCFSSRLVLWSLCSWPLQGSGSDFRWQGSQGALRDGAGAGEQALCGALRDTGSSGRGGCPGRRCVPRKRGRLRGREGAAQSGRPDRGPQPGTPTARASTARNDRQYRGAL